MVVAAIVGGVNWLIGVGGAGTARLKEYSATRDHRLGS